MKRLVLASVVALYPVTAFAGGHAGGGETHDHRGGDDNGGDRDHRDSGGGGGGGGNDLGHGGETRDHRDNDSGGTGYYDQSNDYRSEPGYYGSSSPSGPSIDDGTLPTVTWEAGFLAPQFRGPSIARAGTVDFDQTYGYNLTSGESSAGDSAGVALDLRALLAASDRVYSGAELQIGALTRSNLEVDGRMSGPAAFAISNTTMIGGAGVIGARTRSDRLELDAEVALGLRTYSSQIQAFADGMTNQETTETIVRPLVEGRLRGVVWLSPRWFVSAEVGAGALDRSDVSGVISIGGSSRAFADPYGTPH